MTIVGQLTVTQTFQRIVCPIHHLFFFSLFTLVSLTYVIKYIEFQKDVIIQD